MTTTPDLHGHLRRPLGCWIAVWVCWSVLRMLSWSVLWCLLLVCVACIACPKCMQVSLSETCMQNLYKTYQKIDSLRCQFFDNSDTLSTKTTNSYVGPYNVSTLSIFLLCTTRIQVWCTELVRNLYATCTQTCQVLYQSTYAVFFGI
jgi:hypothetical protein